MTTNVDIEVYRRYLTKRTLKDSVRFYKLELFITLFGEYMVERVYGNVCFKAPTGRRLNYFNEKDAALDFYGKTLRKRIKRGYK